MKMRNALAGMVLLLCAIPGFAASGNYLYRAQMVQAAPGKMLELIGLYQKQAAVLSSAGDLPPFMMRHSQGDHWDLMLIYPMGSYGEYYSAERTARRKKGEAQAADLAAKIQQDIAWQEDLFVNGPALEQVTAAFSGAGFFHIEMIRALPGHQADLLKERQAESDFQKKLNRPELFIFVRDQGAPWDVFSIDFYKDLKDYAASADIPAEKQIAAAKAVGLSSPADFGPYFRTILADHHDTLAVAIAPPKGQP